MFGKKSDEEAEKSKAFVLPEDIDYGDLKRLTDLVGEMTKLLIKYLKKGYKPEDIAKTFCQIFSKQFERALDEEAIKILNVCYPNPHREGSLGGNDLTGQICFKMSSSFIDIFCKTIAKKRD